MIQAVLASVGYAGGILVNKLILDVNKFSMKKFYPLLFIFLALLAGLLMPFWGGYEAALVLEPRYILLFLAMVTIAITWNVFYYQGIKKENLQEFELIMLLSPLVTIVLAGVFLPGERDFTTLLVGGMAALVLVAAKFRKHHLALSKTAKHTMVAMFFFSLEAIFIKNLLDVYSPVSLYFFRTLALAVVFLIVYKPKSLLSDKKDGLLILASASMGVLQMVLKFYGFRDLGVVETTVILLLGPIMVYAGSGLLFHEKLLKRDLAAASIIAACVLYVSIFG